MALSAFIVRPFGKKAIITNNSTLIDRLKEHESKESNSLYELDQIGNTSNWEVTVNFDKVHELLIAPALEPMKIRAETAGAIIVAGNIREDMFNRLITDDLVIADLSMNNANVYYELGLRQAFRDKYTFIIRSNLSEYPFDLKTDRYFDYDLVDLIKENKNMVDALNKALRGTITSNKPDSPVFKLLPNLEAEDRSRFISVPEEFREEVGRAHFFRLPEHLGVLAIECADTLWEAEGLREVGRAQFEANFIDDAKVTWEKIANRYPDDIEANTTLSTIYQRHNDIPRSEQALARVSRLGSLTASRQSQLRSLNGRNLREAWTKYWQAFDESEWQAKALSSPLFQRAYEAFEDSFKADLNNAYAGLNALSLLVIQTELSNSQPDIWQSIQRTPQDFNVENEKRQKRISQLISALELAVESEQDRLRRESNIDPWFNLLLASVQCIVSNQPQYVAQLFADARHFAPAESECTMRRALKVYQDLQIKGSECQQKLTDKSKVNQNNYRVVGTIGENVARALKELCSSDYKKIKTNEPKRILMFAGLKLSSIAKSDRDNECNKASIEELKDRIKQAVESEQGKHEIVFAMAAGGQGSELLFHEICHELDIPTRLCLAVPRAEYVGRYVADAGSDWVERFSGIYRRIDEERKKCQEKTENIIQPWAIHCFSDTNELPRWLQGRSLYNVGRRNNLWMLQHALVTANQFGENTEVTLLVYYDRKNTAGIGSIGHMAELAAMSGIKVITLDQKTSKDEKNQYEPNGQDFTDINFYNQAAEIKTAAKAGKKP